MCLCDGVWADVTFALREELAAIFTQNVMTLSPRMQRCISSLWHTLFLCVVVVVCSSIAQTPLPFLPSDQLIAVNCPHLQEAMWLSDISNWKVAARSSWMLQACRRLHGTPPSYADTLLLCERCSRVWPEWMITWHTGNDVKHWSLSVGLCSEV